MSENGPLFSDIYRSHQKCYICIYTAGNPGFTVLDHGYKKNPHLIGEDLAVILGGMIPYAASRNWAALRKSSLLMSSDLTTLVIGRCLRTLPLALVIV